MESGTRRYSSQYWTVSLLPHEIGGSGTGTGGCFVVQRILANSPDQGQLPLLTPDPHPDNINGKSSVFSLIAIDRHRNAEAGFVGVAPFRYFIKSTVKPYLYWYWNTKSNRIELSSASQTKFILKRRSPLPYDCLPSEDILIKSDEIQMLPLQDNADENRLSMVTRFGQTKRNLSVDTVPVSVDSYSRLRTFVFGLFDGGFGVQYVTPSEQVDGADWVYCNCS
ncbi:hypothetical protein NP233_g12254 [Leucocoprinus birnbaumii]|uniref:Uncharacterized protein n=1 Tax=Leucocoprinus birnbaumii TaxID=56174 RepID=A0AAD5YJL6_9AGAR|nr:hypothetical protein NP233_g12254 [Leucocoprinus birnbaumii]